VILVDTSVWVDYFRGDGAVERLSVLLEEGDVLMHPWVLGELALGHLGPRRDGVLADLDQLPSAPSLSDQEMLELIKARRLWGRGIGWVDVQLVGSALLSGARFWTGDHRLAQLAVELGLNGGG
jgi:hypothetical protein